MHQPGWLRFALFTACLAAAHAAAGDLPDDLADARAQFAAGTEAVRAQDFETALEAFRAARDAGLGGPAVHYNIGVCAWELGQLDEAEQAFLAVAAYPDMAGLAYYNLGLINQRRGDEARARTWFARVSAATDDADLRRLAAVQLGEVEPAPPIVRPATPQPIWFASLQAGYDDNVALVADGAVLGISDTDSAFAEARVAGMAPLTAGLRLEGSAYLLRYEALEEFNQSGLQLGLVAQRQLGDWRGELGADYGLNFLDGDRFEDRAGLAVSGHYPLTVDWNLRLRYRYEDITGRSGFNALSGDRHEAALRLHQRAPAYRLRLEYRFETNDRRGDFVSPDRHRVEAEWLLDTPGRLETMLRVGWRRSSYSLAGENQNENLSFAAIGLSGVLQRQWRWTVRYDWERNSADAVDFDFTRNRIYAGVEAIF